MKLTCPSLALVNSTNVIYLDLYCEYCILTHSSYITQHLYAIELNCLCFMYNLKTSHPTPRRADTCTFQNAKFAESALNDTCTMSVTMGLVCSGPYPGIVKCCTC